VFGAGDDLTGPADDDLALGGQGRSGGRALDQGETELSLESVDRSAGIGLGHAHGSGGGTEAASLGNADKEPQHREIRPGSGHINRVWLWPVTYQVDMG